MPEDSYKKLYANQYPATKDGLYPAIIGVTVAYQGKLMWAKYYKSLRFGKVFDLPHSLRATVLEWKGLKSVQFNCRKAGKNVHLHEDFSFGRIYADGTVRHEGAEIGFEAIAFAMAATSSGMLSKTKRKTKKVQD